MSNPTFSVIIPAYNAATTLRSTVESAQKQTIKNIQIIIVDDGSTDQTTQIMLELASEDPRIRAISQSNSGVSAARNFGAKMARGRLLAFLDADDQWQPDKLVYHLAIHEADELIDASFAKVAFCPEKNGEIVDGRSVSATPYGYIDLSDVLIENATCTTSNLVIDAVAFAEIGGFDESLRYAEDQELLVRLIEQGRLIRGISACLVKYRMSEDGLSCDFEAMLHNWRSFAAEWLGSEELAKAEAIYCRYLTRRALRSGAEISVARSLVRRGLRSDKQTFLSGGKRSLLTLSGAIAGGAMPAAMRRSVFA
ncbi:MAG: glycosyltransferase family A protein [Erythrobacter sp.]